MSYERILHPILPVLVKIVILYHFKKLHSCHLMIRTPEVCHMKSLLSTARVSYHKAGLNDAQYLESHDYCEGRNELHNSLLLQFNLDSM